MKSIKNLVAASIFIILYSCSGNATLTVKDIIKSHPEAHSILFFDPASTIIAEGDKSMPIKRVDYITFGENSINIKFIDEKEFRIDINEPTFGSKGAMFYNSDGNYSLSINLGGCTIFETKDKKLIASYFTKADKERMTEYMNVLIEKGGESPKIMKRLLELYEHKDSPYYSFD